jgi:ketosteroid isomerase-like protein
MTRISDNLELIIFGWIASVRDGDPAHIADHLAPDLVWQGIRPDLVCSNRDEVLANLRDGTELRHQVHGIELTATEDRVMLGIRLPGLTEMFGEPIAGEMFDVFTFRDGTIIRIDEYTSREAAEAASREPVPGRVEAPPPPEPEPPAAIIPGPPPPAQAAVQELIPFVHVADMARSVSLYELLGFQVSDTYHHRGELVWAALRRDAARLMLACASAPIDPAEQAVLFYLYSRDLAALRDHLLAHGVQAGEIVDGTPGPRREMRVTDPDGYCLMIAEIEE